MIFKICLGLAAWFAMSLLAAGAWAAIRRHQCRHLRPALMDTDGGISLFRCLDCGELSIEGIGA